MPRQVLARWCLAIVAAAGCSRPTPAPTLAVASAPSALAQLESAIDLDGQPVGPLPADGRATIAVVFASWCVHCRQEMPVLAELGRRQPRVRILGVNYRGHEEYEQRGDAAGVRAFVAEQAPWLRVVPIDDRAWAALGRPPKVPSVYVFDRDGRLVSTFDRRRDPVPTLAELEAALPP